MPVTGAGADDSMEMITTSTSGRDGGESRAKWKRTRRLWPSKTVTGNRAPAEERSRGEGKESTMGWGGKGRPWMELLTGLDGFQGYEDVGEGDFGRGRGFSGRQAYVQQGGGVVERLQGEGGLGAEGARLVLEVSQGGLGLVLVPDTRAHTDTHTQLQFEGRNVSPMA